MSRTTFFQIELCCFGEVCGAYAVIIECGRICLSFWPLLHYSADRIGHIQHHTCGQGCGVKVQLAEQALWSFARLRRSLVIEPLILVAFVFGYVAPPPGAVK